LVIQYPFLFLGCDWLRRPFFPSQQPFSPVFEIYFRNRFPWLVSLSDFISARKPTRTQPNPLTPIWVVGQIINS